MSNCAIATCSNYYRTTEGTEISYHRFPKDDAFRKIWILKCKRKDKFNAVTARVCSVHFQPSDYERDLKAELLGIQRQKKLKSDAVPILNLSPPPQIITNQSPVKGKKTNNSSSSVTLSTPGGNGTVNRNPVKMTIPFIKRKIIEENITEVVGTDHSFSINGITSPATSEVIEFFNLEKYRKNSNVISDSSKSKGETRSRKERYNARSIRKRALDRLNNISLKVMNDKATNTDCVYVNMLAQLKDMEKKNASLKLQMCKMHAIKTATEVRFKKRLSELQDKMKKKEQHHQIAIKTREQNLEFAYIKVFSDAQIRWLQRGRKNRVCWEEEDIAFSHTLRGMSRKCYTYLRKKGFPLPGLTTLRTWKKNCKGMPDVGILEHVPVCSNEATPSVVKKYVMEMNANNQTQQN